MEALLNWHLTNMMVFWTAQHNPLREGPPLRPETVSSHSERLKRLVQWCGSNSVVGDPLMICCNMSIVSRYLDEQAGNGVVSGSRARVCDALLSLLRCSYANPMQKPPWSDTVIQSLRTVRNSLQSQYEVELRSKSNREALDEVGKWADWSDIVMASKQIIVEFEQLHYQVQQSKHDEEFDWTCDDMPEQCATRCQEAVISIIMTAIPPGRGLEYRTLQIGMGIHGARPKPDPTKRENVLTTDQDGQYLLRLTHFKNSSTVGSCDVPLPTQPRISNIISLWIKSYRKVMLQGQAHPFCFVRSAGSPFTNASQWCNQLVSIFQPRLPNKARVSVNVLRKSFLTETWGSATLEERESNAAAMRHSLSVASKSYNAATSRDRVETAVQRASQIWHDGGSSSSSANSEPRVPSSVPSVEPTRKSTRLLSNLSEPKERIELSPIDSCESFGDTIERKDASLESDRDSSGGSSMGVVEYLVRSRKRRGGYQYLVHWTDQTESWEDEEELPRVCIREFFTVQMSRACKKSRK